MFSEGDQIGSYVLRRRLGAGGMGQVFLAEHRRMDKKAAIKVLLPELSNKADLVERFFTEARATSRIKHPGIIEVLDCDVHPSGAAYIVMEFLDGESLGDALGRVERFDNQSAFAITGQIASALAAAHEKGIVHRDLKPDNIFLASNRGAEAPIALKVLDFGIAKLVSERAEDIHQTATGSLLGTPLYMSPEQCRGAGKVDHRTDIYSLGCIAFEMVAGRPPFMREGAGELIAAHLSDPPPDLGTTEPGVDPTFAAMVMAMLAKNPDRRPQSMIEVVSRVEELLKVRSPRFATLIIPPDGFPPPQASLPPLSDTFARPHGGKTPWDSHRRKSASDPEIGGTQRLPSESTTFNQTASEIATPSVPSRRSAPIGLILGGIVAAAAVVGVITHFVLNSGRPPSAPVVLNSDPPLPAPATVPAPAEPPPTEVIQATPPRVVIDVDSDPPGAQVWLPDEATPRGVTPYRLSLFRENAKQSIILKASGHVEKRVLVDASADGKVRVKLEEKNRPRGPRPQPRKVDTNLKGDDRSAYPVVGE